jgi:hypothetical protein
MLQLFALTKFRTEDRFALSLKVIRKLSPVTTFLVQKSTEEQTCVTVSAKQ